MRSPRAGSVPSLAAPMPPELRSLPVPRRRAALYLPAAPRGRARVPASRLLEARGRHAVTRGNRSPWQRRGKRGRGLRAGTKGAVAPRPPPCRGSVPPRRQGALRCSGRRGAGGALAVSARLRGAAALLALVCVRKWRRAAASCSPPRAALPAEKAKRSNTKYLILLV